MIGRIEGPFFRGNSRNKTKAKMTKALILLTVTFLTSILICWQPCFEITINMIFKTHL